MTTLSPNAEAIRHWLSGVAVIGPRPVPDELTDAELGALAALVWCPDCPGDASLAYDLREALRRRAPVFDEDAAIGALQALARSAMEAGEEREPGVDRWMEDAAAKVVAGCGAGLTPTVRSSLEELVSCGLRGVPSPVAAALQSCLGREPEQHPDPFVRRERGFMCRLPDVRDRIAMAQLCSGWRYGVDDEELTPRGADPLALLPGYLALAEDTVRDALAHVRRIHAGREPYAADKAFSVDGAQAVRNALLAGLDQDAPWALEAAAPLFAGVSLAPNDEAKTVPSQSAAIAFAKTIAERPSIGLVADLEAAVRKIRHAGVKRKCLRFVKTAQRRVFERDDFLLELEPGARIPKSMSGTVTRALELLLLPNRSVPFEAWRSHLLGHAAVARLAAALVWRFEGQASALPVRRGKGWSFENAQGQPVHPADGPVSLWHPLDEDSDAAQWRVAVARRGIEQPFNQVFRETYSATSIASLLEPELDVRTLVGLARAQGWLLQPGGLLVRRIGDVRIQLEAGRAYPGATGSTRCYSVLLLRGASRQPLDFAAEDAKLVSECMRAVDLLVSVSAFALSPNEAESASAQARRAALVAMLGTDPSDTKPYVDGRRVRVGEVSISIATGRATRDGAELEEQPNDGATVVPYPDDILRRIVTTLNRVSREAAQA